MAAEKSHYEVLKVPRSASQEEIEAQYHQLLYQCHPDHNPGDEERAVERTIALVNAYRTLSDPERRRKYDFQLAHPLIEEARTKGLQLFKSREKKEAEARFAEGVGLWRQGEVSKAVEAFKAALKWEPAFPEAYYNLAVLGAMLGNPQFGLEVVARGLKEAPGDAYLLRLRKSLDTLLTAC